MVKLSLKGPQQEPQERKRRGVTILNEPIDVKNEDIEEHTHDASVQLIDINNTLLLILKQLELITGEIDYG